MQTSIDEFLWPNKALLGFLGFWPEKSDTTGVKPSRTTRITISIFVVSALFVPQIYTVIMFWNDLSILAEVGSITLEVAQLLFKFLYMIVRRKKFCRLYQNARKFWTIASNEEEQENIEKLAKFAKNITIIFFICGLANVFTFVPASLLIWYKSKKRANDNETLYVPLPLDLRYGISTQHSPNYEIALCCQTISVTYCAIGVIGFDATMMTLILHICGQFRIICTRFRSLNAFTIVASQRKIGQYIAHHRQTIRVAGEMRELLSPVIFVQLMSSAIEICLCGYLLILGNRETSDLIKSVVYTVTIFAQVGLWCWPGELLIQDSAAVGDAICHELPWYYLPAHQQRNIVFLILRAQRNCCVTALNFQIMSLSKLADIFNTAASYFALLRSVVNK